MWVSETNVFGFVKNANGAGYVGHQIELQSRPTGRRCPEPPAAFRLPPARRPPPPAGGPTGHRLGPDGPMGPMGPMGPHGPHGPMKVIVWLLRISD